MEQEYIINQISDRLNQLSDRLKSREHSATVLEGVCHKLFNALFGWNLSNLNQEHYSFAAVDLGDKAQRVAIQITVQDGSGKATHTLRQIDSAGHRQHYSLFICFFLVPKAPGSQTADPPDFHRWGIRDLIEGILKPLHVPDWLKPFVPSALHSLSITALQRALAVLEETLADRRFGPQPPKRLAYHLHPDAHAGFIGRKELLKELRTALKPGKNNVIQQARAVHADGGVGKTSLAIHLGVELFAKETFDYVLFLAATSADALRGDLTALCNAQYLNLPAQEAREATVQYQAVLAFLSQPTTSRRTLFILDGADNEEARAAVSSLRGELPGCAFLITSRHADWGKGVTPFPLELFTDAEARDFLRDRLEKSTAIPDELLDTIARELGHLPLALEIAASYIRSQRLRPQDWLQEWQNAPAATYEHHHKDHLHYPLPLGRVWDQSFARLDESARQLLHCLAFIAPRPAALPLEAFEKLQLWPSLRQNLVTLAAASLIQWDNAEKTLLIHRLLQAVTRQCFTAEESQNALTAVLSWMPVVLPKPEWSLKGWKLWHLLEPHLETLLSNANKTTLKVQDTELGLILNQYALWLYHRAQYDEAEPLFRLALKTAEISFGLDHRNVASALGNLALLFYATGRLAEAEEPMRRVVAIFEQRLGKNHANVATSLNNLAMLLLDMNRLAEAEEPMWRALQIDEARCGPDHPDVARDLSNLTTLLYAMKRHAEAEVPLRRVVTIFEKSLGKDHPNVATALNNLAQLLQDTNRLAEAEEPMRRALKIDEACYGQNHPNVARDLNNLAQLLKATNRLAEAEEPMRRALKINEASCGPDHPDVARDLNNLAILLQATNRLAEAEELMRRHVVIFARFTSQTSHAHPNLRDAIHNYRLLLLQKGLPESQAAKTAVSALPEGGLTPEQIQQVVSS
ncbi:MAG: tetratricopeptide repeat protein [Verrucomicrobiaceae bacterium]|nr:tetratricopeptide repeat protein [Verrucomicrobiaceae bacterium]